MLIDAADRIPPDRLLARASACLARLARWFLRRMARHGAVMSAHDFSDHQLADLNIRRWELGYPDPREPRLF